MSPLPGTPGTTTDRRAPSGPLRALRCPPAPGHGRRTRQDRTPARRKPGGPPGGRRQERSGLLGQVPARGPGSDGACGIGDQGGERLTVGDRFTGTRPDDQRLLRPAPLGQQDPSPVLVDTAGHLPGEERLLRRFRPRFVRQRGVAVFLPDPAGQRALPEPSAKDDFSTSHTVSHGSSARPFPSASRRPGPGRAASAFAVETSPPQSRSAVSTLVFRWRRSPATTRTRTAPTAEILHPCLVRPSAARACSLPGPQTRIRFPTTGGVPLLRRG